MTALAQIQLVDLAEIYVQIGNMPGRLHGPKRTAQQAIIPGRAGSIITDLVSAGGREINFNGVIFADTLLLTTRQAAEDEFKELAYHSRVNVCVSDGTNAPRVIEGYATSLPIDPKGLTSLALGSDFAISILAEPFWRDKYPRQYALTETPVELPLGNAPCSPIVRVMGAATPVVSPVITLRRMSGEIIGTLEFDISLGDDDYVEHDFHTGMSRRIAAGVITEDSGMVDGDLFLALQPKHGSRQLNAWGTAELSSASGTPTGEIQYTRAWL